MGHNDVFGYDSTWTTLEDRGFYSSPTERSIKKNKGRDRNTGTRSNRIDNDKNQHKWNYYREDEKDYDKIYWDSIDNHAQDEARGSSEKEVDANLFINVIYR